MTLQNVENIKGAADKNGLKTLRFLYIRAKAKVINFFDLCLSLSLLNVNMQLDYLWKHLERRRFRFRSNVNELLHVKQGLISHSVVHVHRFVFSFMALVLRLWRSASLWFGCCMFNWFILQFFWPYPIASLS